MNKFVVRMLELGVELDKAVSPIEISMVINDAQILYKNHIEQLTIPAVVGQSEQSNCIHSFEHVHTVKTLKFRCTKCSQEKWEQLD